MYFYDYFIKNLRKITMIEKIPYDKDFYTKFEKEVEVLSYIAWVFANIQNALNTSNKKETIESLFLELKGKIKSIRTLYYLYKKTLFSDQMWNLAKYELLQKILGEIKLVINDFYKTEETYKILLETYLSINDKRILLVYDYINKIDNLNHIMEKFKQKEINYYWLNDGFTKIL